MISGGIGTNFYELGNLGDGLEVECFFIATLRHAQILSTRFLGGKVVLPQVPGA